MKKALVSALFALFTPACDLDEDEGSQSSMEDEGAANVHGGSAEENDVRALQVGQTPTALSSQYLGVNYNENADFFAIDNINRAYNAQTEHPPWVRVIFNITVPFLEWKANGAGPNSFWSQAKADEYCAIRPSRADIRTVLNIRWEFKNNNLVIPAVGSAEYTRYANFLKNHVIPKLEPCTDVLVIGNEPWLEALGADISMASNFVPFYKNITDEALSVWPTGKAFYFGSFEALWVRDPVKDSTREALLQFVNNRPRIDGVDLHLHVREMPQIDVAFDWAAQRLDNGKEIIVTEFSPAPAFRDDMDAGLAPSFKDSDWPGVVDSWRNGDYLDFAIKQGPRPIAEFREWTSTLSFSVDHPHFLCGAWEKFMNRPGRFRRAFQGLTQGNMTAAARAQGYSWKWPWILNPVLMPITQQNTTDPDRVSARWNWFEDMQKILKNQACP